MRRFLSDSVFGLLPYKINSGISYKTFFGFVSSGDIGVDDLKFQLALQHHDLPVLNMHEPGKALNICEIQESLSQLKTGTPITLYFHEKFPRLKESYYAYDLETSIVDQKGKRVIISKLFKGISDAMQGNPLDVIFAADKSYLSTVFVPYLPNGSIVVNLADAGETDYLVNALYKNKLDDPSAMGFLNFYLANAMMNRYIPPRIAIAGKGVIDLGQIFKDSIGADFTDEEKAKVHSSLDDLIDAKEIDDIMLKITNVANITLSQYGKAVLICLAKGPAIYKEFDGYINEFRTGEQRIDQFSVKDYGLGEKINYSSVSELYIDPYNPIEMNLKSRQNRSNDSGRIIK